MDYLKDIGMRAKNASVKLALLLQDEKNNALKACAAALLESRDEILDANSEDVKRSRENGVKESLIDRLMLTPERIKAMADGLLEVCALPDPVGEVLSMHVLPNGLVIGEKRVPLGVIGMIYESRPNVTADAFALCFKTGNAVILRGGSDAIQSNKAIVKALHKGLRKSGITEDAVLLIEDTSRELVNKLMRMNDYIDVLIPRGGYSLIQSVKENSSIPVIETGTGNCHIYVDRDADLDMAEKIVINAKTSRPGVCNAVETMLVDAAVAGEFLPKALKALQELNVEIRG